VTQQPKGKKVHSIKAYAITREPQHPRAAPYFILIIGDGTVKKNQWGEKTLEEWGLVRQVAVTLHKN
jgi:hypothetical protein